ncbi:hypothetical protein [Azospirillum doebereinerae]
MENQPQEIANKRAFGTLCTRPCVPFLSRRDPLSTQDDIEHGEHQITRSHGAHGTYDLSLNYNE